MQPSKTSVKKQEPRERIVVDTSVLVSAAFGGRPLAAVEKARSLRVIMSPAIATEIEGVLDRLREKLGPAVHARLVEQAHLLMVSAEWVEPVVRVELCRDPNDDLFLEACVAGRASVLLTGDKDLTELRPDDLERHGLSGLRIETPAQFLKVE